VNSSLVSERDLNKHFDMVKKIFPSAINASCNVMGHSSPLARVIAISFPGVKILISVSGTDICMYWGSDIRVSVDYRRVTTPSAEL
jgi:hypothetical protein